MYDNIGGKIKSLAKWTFIVEAIGSIITGIVLSVDSEDALFLLICLGGPIVAWVSSWILYAFGEMVEDIHAMRNKFSPNNAQEAIKVAKQELQQKRAIAQATETEEILQHAVEERLKVKREWDALEAKNGKQTGRCDMCGKKRQQLIFFQFEDQFGKAERNLCFECFIKKQR